MSVLIIDSVDKPSVITFTGNYFLNDSGVHQYFKNGKLHRDNNPAKVYTNGNSVWYNEGNIHRIGGPAVINYIPLDFIQNIDNVDEDQRPLKCNYNGWYENGLLHRLGGPAIESIHLFNKSKKVIYSEYFINGIEYDEKTYNGIMNNVILFVRKLRIKSVYKKLKKCNINLCEDLLGVVSLFV